MDARKKRRGGGGGGVKKEIFIIIFGLLVLFADAANFKKKWQLGI